MLSDDAPGEDLEPPPRAPTPTASPTCSTSTSTSSTRSPARRRSTGCGSSGRPVRRPDLTVATEDHNVPTADIDLPIADPISAKQVEALRETPPSSASPTSRWAIPNQGIVHVIGPEQGRTLPGHDDRVRRQPHRDARRVRRAGVRHRHERGRARAGHPDAAADRVRSGCAVTVDGELPAGVTAKDIMLAIIGQIGTGGGIGHVIEYRGVGDPGALDGGPDDGVQHVDRGRRPGRARRPRRHHVRVPARPRPRAAGRRSGTRRSPTGATLQTDDGAVWDKEVVIDATTLQPQVTWGTNPGQVGSIDSVVPSPDDFADATDARDGRAGARVHGPATGHADPRDPGRHRVHRLVHEQPHRGSAGGRGGDARPPRHACRG